MNSQQKRFLIECGDCPFERETEGRTEAKNRASEHHDRTEHAVTVLELPRKA